MSRIIPSTKGYAALVDDEDYERLAAFRWYAHNCTRGPRPARRQRMAEGRKVLFLVHQILRAPKGMVVDHVNGDPWDNRRSNLRVCTPKQNSFNKHKFGGSVLNPYKGVRSYRGMWRASISCDGEKYDLGTYETHVKAALAYDKAALVLHGEFACLNFPQMEEERAALNLDLGLALVPVLKQPKRERVPLTREQRLEKEVEFLRAENSILRASIRTRNLFSGS